MESLLSSIFSGKPGEEQFPVMSSSLLKLVSVSESTEERCKKPLERLVQADESTATEEIGNIMNLCIMKPPSAEAAENLVESLLEFAKDKMSWKDAMCRIAAIIHYLPAEELTLSMFAEFGAVEFGVSLLNEHITDASVVTAAASLIADYASYPIGKAIPLLVVALEQLTASSVEVTRAILTTFAAFTSYYGGSADWMQSVANELAENSGIAAVDKAMNAWADDERTQQLGCRIAANIAPIVNDSYIESSSIMKTVAKALENFTDSNSILVGHALYALSNYPHEANVERVAKVLNETTSESIATDAIRCLTGIASRSKEHSGISRALMNNVLDIMKLYRNNLNTMEEGCNLISHMAFDYTNIASAITENGGIDLIIHCMRQNVEQQGFMRSAAAALSSLCFNNTAGQNIIHEQDGVALILEGMRKGNKPRLHEMSALALGTMCWNNELKDQVVEHGGVELLLDSLRKYSASSGLTKNAFRALAQIAYNNDKYRDIIAKTDAAKLIITAMKMHPGHDRTQMHGCVALSYFNWSAEASQEDVDEEYRVIIDAMKNHKQSSDVQEHACRALANIGTPLISCGVKEAIEQVMDAFILHEKVADVQEEACRAVVTLSLQAPGNKEIMMEHHAAEHVIAALSAFPKNNSVQQEACNALAHLTYEHQGLNRIVTELGGVALILQAMRLHPMNSRVQLTACGGLSALAFNNQVAQQQIFDQGGVDCVIQSMRNFPRLRIMELSCSVLGTLAWNSDIKESVATTAIPEILEVMALHESNPLLQKSACHAVSQFAFNSEVNRRKLFEGNVVPLIVKAIRNHKSNEKLVTHALVALTYLCWENATVAEAIMNEGTEDLLVGLEAQYKENEKIYNKASHLRRILVRKVQSPTQGSPISMDRSFSSPIEVQSPIFRNEKRLGDMSYDNMCSPVVNEAVCIMTPPTIDNRDSCSPYNAPIECDRRRGMNMQEVQFTSSNVNSKGNAEQQANRWDVPTYNRGGGGGYQRARGGSRGGWPRRGTGEGYNNNNSNKNGADSGEGRGSRSGTLNWQQQQLLEDDPRNRHSRGGAVRRGEGLPRGGQRRGGERGGYRGSQGGNEGRGRGRGNM